MGLLDPVKISHKTMTTEGGHIDFMFLGPSTQPLLGTATVVNPEFPREGCQPRGGGINLLSGPFFCPETARNWKH